MYKLLQGDIIVPRLSSGKTSAKSAQTQKRIIAVFLDLASQRKWYKISVKEICASAKITRGTFYQYFDDIYDLMEGIQSDLLKRLKISFNSLPKEHSARYSYDEFPSKFDYSPPIRLCVWLDFVRKNKNLLLPLFDTENGDPGFVQKIKNILKEQVNMMMDNDGLPRDQLRVHFLKVYTELHFLSVRTWLEIEDSKKTLSLTDIVNLLNTMRCGAKYLTYKKLTSPDFDTKMNIERILQSLNPTTTDGGKQSEI
jgi:AcrR family transcriptional regulator